MAWVHLKVYMHLGGSFATHPTLSYVGGKVMERDLDPDMLCYYTLCDMVKEGGYRAVKYFSYCEPGLSFDEGLRICYDDSSVIAMINHLRNLGSLHIYVEHVVDILIVAEDMTLLPSIKDATHDINTGGGTTNEQAWVDGVSNEVNIELSRPNSPIGEHEENNCRSIGVEEWVSTDLETSLDTEDFLGVASEDDEIRDILTKAKKKKKILASEELHVEDEPTFEDQKGQRKKKRNGSVEKAIEKSDESGEETDYFDSSDLGSRHSDSEGEFIFRKTHHVYFDRTNPIPRFQLGMVFHGAEEFKEALAKYAIAKRFEIIYKRNESERTRAWCKQEGCPFRIYAALDKADGLYKIKTFKETHECSITFKNTRASYKYVGKHFLSKLRVLPKLKLTEMQKLGKEELKVDLSRGTCSRAKRWALEEINGRVLYEFTRLFDYAYALRQANPTANIELMVERPTPFETPKFRRFYVGFTALRDGFKKCCRPFLCLDGCFLKGKFKGEILTAVGDGDGFTLMTDQQKGLKEEIVELLPRVEHRVCARHLYANWRKENPGGDLKKEFWAACKSTTDTDFEHHISKIEQLKATAKESLMKTDPKQWSKSCFFTRSDCDATDNNFAEAFNFAIIGARSMSIISLLEEIRQYVMGRIVNNMSKCSKWEKLFCPKICAKLEQNKEMSAYCHVRWNGAQGFEVVCSGDVLVVNLEHWSCSCRTWDLTGIPCAHAIAAILWKKDDVNDYVYRGYKKEMYQMLYSHVLPAVPSEKFWVKTKMGPIDPPLPRKMPGRPKRNRVREEGETKCGTKLSRRGRKMRCQKCFKLGHNSRKCPNTTNGASASTTPFVATSPITHATTEETTQAVVQAASYTSNEVATHVVTQTHAAPQAQLHQVTSSLPLLHQVMHLVFKI
ncbi:hypothetical protein GQ457_10G018050 [Hibiscus cannabinus]